jgi:short-subunit dehydrogenase
MCGGGCEKLAVTGRLALVTGASAGIGAAFARLYAQAGCDLVLTARREDRLEALAAELRAAHGVRAMTIAADLSKPGAVDVILGEIAAAGATVDVLVNNAGYGLPGTWRGTTWEAQAAALQLMLTAPLELSHKLLPGMVERRWGRILNIASLAGFAPGGPGHTTYAAIKSALIRFSQSLHAELEGTGVHCTAVCPGLTYSEFHDVNGTRARVSQAPARFWQSAEEVVEAGYDASEHNRAVVVTGATNKLIAVAARITPDALAMEISKGLREKYGGGKE